jgi:adenosylmethionine-8-amino-7-oxononanoate aminotransferase
MFAAQTFGATPDILCMGKGMSSGYAPLAGIAIRDSIAEAFLGNENEGVEFAHGHTYGGNPVSSAAGLACLTEILEQKLCDRAEAMGSYLRQKLQRVAHLGVVGDIRGKGLLIGIEFVRDPTTKEPFPDRLQFGVQVGREALQRGLLLRFDPHWIAIAPPLTIREEEIDLLADILADSIRTVLSEIKRC